mgnify:CR=1 FL=1
MNKFTKQFNKDIIWKEGEIGVLIYGDFKPAFYQFEEKTYKDHGDLWFSLEKIYCYVEKTKKGNYFCIYTKKSKTLVLKIKIEKPLDLLKEARAKILRPLFITEEDLQRQKLEKQLFNEFLNVDNKSKVTIKKEWLPFVIVFLKAMDTISGVCVEAKKSFANLGYTKPENIGKVQKIKNDVNLNLNSATKDNTINLNSISHNIIFKNLGRRSFKD